MLTFWRRYWYYIGGVLFVAAAFIMGFWGCYNLNTIQVMLVFSWMAMLVHQFEEYALPGGFPLLSNLVVMGEVDQPESYPLNSFQCWLSNVIFCYAAYLIPVFFPDMIWMAACQIFAGVWQITAHGFVLNRRMQSWYSPGLGATLFLQLPLAIYFVWYVCTNMPEQATQMLWGIPGSLLLLMLVFGLPIIILRRRDGSHPFEDRELYGFKKERVDEIWAEKKKVKRKV